MFQQHFLLSRTNRSRERKNRKDRNREMRKMAGNRKGHYKCQMEGNQQTSRQKRQQKKNKLKSETLVLKGNLY